MRKTETNSFGHRWEQYQKWWDDYRPPKSLWLWASISSAIFTVAVGFTVCGWTTRATAEKMVAQAARAARSEMLINTCTQGFHGRVGIESGQSEFNSDAELQRPVACADAAIACVDKLDGDRGMPAEAVTSPNNSGS